MVGIWFVLRPLEVGSVELEREGGGGKGREGKMKFKHVCPLSVLCWHVVLVKNCSCK